MTIPNIRHEIIELVQCNARRELFPRVVDFCGTVKILFNIIALYQADKYVLPRILKKSAGIQPLWDSCSSCISVSWA